MAFPKLVLEGDADSGRIYDIYLTNGGDTYEHDRLIRQSYRISSQNINKNVSSGTAARSPDVAYDYTRKIHTFIAFADVSTDSTCKFSGQSVQDQKTFELLQEGAIFYNTLGIPYFIDLPTDIGLGGQSRAASAGSGYVPQLCYLPAPIWITSNPADSSQHSSNYWVIKEVNIVDNMNMTSRVSITFESISIFSNFYSKIQ